MARTTLAFGDRYEGIARPTGISSAIKSEADLKNVVAPKKIGEINEKTHSTVILCLTDNVLREKEMTTASV